MEDIRQLEEETKKELDNVIMIIIIRVYFKYKF